MPALAASPPAEPAGSPVVVGSKRFTESYLLGEIVTQTLRRAGIAAEHRQGLGNTAILEQALASGAIAVYPEYTGTIARELLKLDTPAPTLAALNARLAPHGLKAAVPLGFNNTYALAMREDTAARLGVDSISALARLPTAQARALRLGLSHEFLQRADGWPSLQRAYALPLQPGSGLDHGLAYQALARGQVDVIDVYTTDAQIARLRLRVLRDDRNFFPRYDAVLLMRATLDERPLAMLAGRIDAAAMTAMNAAAELDGRAFADVAREFLDRTGSPAAASAPTAAPPATPSAPGFLQRLLAPDLGRLLRQHLAMVFGSLALAVLVGVPLGVLAHRHRRFAGVVMGAVGVLQTVPSLALLAFLIALLGTIGFVPALLALFVYALLPIVRNTHAGLASVSPGLTLAGAALGLRRGQLLRLVELPLALPTLLAGIKTAAVINVGTATVAAFVGAGGLGERIVSGLAVNDHTQTLAGAVPAALLALVVQALFDWLERRLQRSG
ncbi:glycine betaine ABC transporter substrate-binding protein [Azohydromonas caseinilytica]|uniref:ABC transporter permease subunit n=1 Tax=Azohydromonas caseinilytica TaxID=2728836 RepID=A0A848FCS1_9BURK|nr:glycine betaine ABC transporter substrate-binding protein [Azohydromonas caseinilytica]NML17274.1 ABC transporter permease subunit [Azohydromonas caseinilytica]